MWYKSLRLCLSCPVRTLRTLRGSMTTGSVLFILVEQTIGLSRLLGAAAMEACFGGDGLSSV